MGIQSYFKQIINLCNKFCNYENWIDLFSTMGEPKVKNLLKAGYTDLLLNDHTLASVYEFVTAGACDDNDAESS